MIDRNNHTPLYMQLYEALKLDISAGKYAKGEHLPPEREMCTIYNIDRATVRKALEMLKQEGYIERKQGRGTSVVNQVGTAAQLEGGNILFALLRSAKRGDRISEPFYARSVDLLDQYLHGCGYRMVYSVLHSKDDIESLARLFCARGVILAGTIEEDRAFSPEKLSLPTVVYNSYLEGMASVVVDNERGAMIAARYLNRLGHQHIGFIDVPGFANSQSRLHAFSRVLNEMDLPSPVIEQADWTEEGGYNAMRELLRKAPQLTAVFSGNDVMGIGALRALREAERRVPGDFSVIGFDGVPQAESSNPPLTTMTVDIPAMVDATCMLLFHMMEKQTRMNINVVVPTQLTERASSARIDHLQTFD